MKNHQLPIASMKNQKKILVLWVTSESKYSWVKVWFDPNQDEYVGKLFIFDTHAVSCDYTCEMFAEAAEKAQELVDASDAEE